MHSSTVLAIQSWTLYATSVSLIFSRLTFRRITLGSFKRLQADDWLMVSILVPFTSAIVLANQILRPPSVEDRKFRYALEELQIITIWLVKACLLVLWWRICPIEASPWKRRILKGVSVYYCISFLAVQISLFAWCPPTAAHWDLTTTNSQCITYHASTAMTLSFNIPDILLIMMLPVPFIPTPRRLLLAILFILGALVLAAGIIARTTILTSTSHMYLHWYIAESTLSILFANLPFLTSLVVATTPSRIRDFSQNLRASSSLALSQWPRSRRGSFDGSRRGSWASQPHPRTPRLNSIATTLGSPIDVEKAQVHTHAHHWSENSNDAWKAGLPPSSRGSGSSGSGKGTVQIDEAVESAKVSTPVSTPVEPVRLSVVPKTRLSGGLAEMGDLSTQSTEGWPIYWK